MNNIYISLIKCLKLIMKSKIGVLLMRAKFVQKRIYEDSSYKQIRAKIVQNMILKIRGRVFIGKRFGFEDYDQDSRSPQHKKNTYTL